MASDPSTPVYSRTPEGAFYIDSQSGLQLVTDPNTLTGLETGQGQQGSIPYTQETSDTLQSPPASQNGQSGIDTSNPQNIFLLSMMNMLRQAQQAGTPTNLISQQTALQQLQNNTNANPTTFGGGSLAGLPYSEIQQIESANANLYTPEQDVVSNAIKEQDARLQTFNTLFSNADSMGKEVLDQMTPPQDIINGYIQQMRFGTMPTNLTTGAQAALSKAIGEDPTIMQQYYNAIVSGKNLQPFTPGSASTQSSSSVVTNVLNDAGLGFLGNENMKTAANSVAGFAQTLANQLIAGQGTGGAMPGLEKANNPGAIKFSGLPGQTDSGIQAADGGTYAKYATPEAGQAAVLDLVNNAINKGENLEDFVASYMGVPAPSSNVTAPNGGSFGGTGQLTPKQETAAKSIVSSFNASQSVKNYSNVATAYNIISNVDPNTTDPAVQQQVNVAFAQLLSPGSSTLRGIMTLVDPTQYTSGVFQQIRSVANYFTATGKLDSSAIKSIQSVAKQIVSDRQQAYNQEVASSTALLQGAGITDPSQQQTLLGLGSAQGNTPAGSGSTNSGTPTLIPPSQIPAGYYQASDGLLYKK